MTARTRAPRSGSVKATREDWLRAAVKVLVTEGVDHVLVLPLAARLKVSRSSFYWYFRNRQELLEHLLQHWRETNTQAIISHAGMPSKTVIEGVLHIFECWMDERLYSPGLDFAVRNWARKAPAVKRLIERADAERLAAIKKMFLRHGFDEEHAFIRARVLYCMQVGYYVVDLRESLEARLSHLEAYLQAFTGENPAPGQIERFRTFRRSRGARRGNPASRRETQDA